jgi:hypothetical protein
MNKINLLKSFSVICALGVFSAAEAKNSVTNRSGIKFTFEAVDQLPLPLTSPLLAMVKIEDRRGRRSRPIEQSIGGHYRYADNDRREAFFATLGEDGETAYLVGLGYGDAHPYFVSVKYNGRRNVEISNPMALAGEPGTLTKIRAVTYGASTQNPAEKGFIISTLAKVYDRDARGLVDKIYFRTGFYHAFAQPPHSHGWSQRLPDFAENLIDAAERAEGLRGFRDREYDELLRDRRHGDRDDNDRGRDRPGRDRPGRDRPDHGRPGRGDHGEQDWDHRG